MRFPATPLAVVLLCVLACKQPTPAAPPAPTPDHRHGDNGGVDHDHGHDNDSAHKHAGPPAPTTTKSVQFVWPMSGSKVFSSFPVRFGVNGMGLRPAGEDPLDKTTGHHHVLVDAEPIALGQVIPKDDTHLHFGKAEQSAQLSLSPGPHKLLMQLADGAHISYGLELSATIDVNVVPAPAKMGVFFKNIKDGDTIAQEQLIEFGVDGFALRPALEDVLDKTTGHHHLIVDDAAPALGDVVAKDERHIHFGKAETQTTLKLSPGPHTLTLQLADGAHLSYGPALSATIKVTVK
jgi:hypothetical protein